MRFLNFGSRGVAAAALLLSCAWPTLANILHPEAVLGGDSAAAATQQASLVPFTVIFAEDEAVTGEYLKDVIASYLESDDIF
ncbi:hypothetical protein GGR53DRAFT_468196 [Hypoxylon sp. FL1150]|nr:hypothetical protein GGR53DRAFT_468196 [Hypoxylon sp. FL1150]